MNINDVDKIVPLFKKDHEFYHATSNINDIKNYLLDRVKKNESVIYYVEDENKKNIRSYKSASVIIFSGNETNMAVI
ncbi:hypothetical protein LU604_15375 [Erwinia tracheiphila]|uniref:hypothetical protein n=1 Tax=Erwinia tracheiphila TaxID=65700 RepID=UPI001F1B2A7C|nr:hypothetical protein [Erwinia tracheiphila]UIA82022.1 hypothetical protein LU604_15375 [Erwinia tracheiphila]